MTKVCIMILKLFTVVLALFALNSCVNVGSRSISASRSAYAEAIDQTENNHLRLLVVTGRYGETACLLAINTIASNIRFRSEARSQLHVNIQDALNTAGIQILSPHFEAIPDTKVWVPPAHGEGESNAKPTGEKL